MNDIKQYTILDAASSTGPGKSIYVGDAKSVHFTFATDGGGTADLTVQFQKSTQQKSPDFSASQAVDNMWDYADVIDNQDGSAIDGDTGVSVAGGDDYRNFTMNIDPGVLWVTANVTAYTAGAVTVDVTLSSK